MHKNSINHSDDLIESQLIRTERPINVIGIDNIEAGRIAARRLLASGYNDVGFLGGPEKATSTRDRLEGFLDVLSDYPKIKTRVHFAGDYTFEAGFDEMASMILRGLSQAYFCADDVISIHRYTQHPERWMVSDIHVRKVKETETGGRPTSMDAPISLRMQPGNCSFTVAGKDVITQPKEPAFEPKLNLINTSPEMAF